MIKMKLLGMRKVALIIVALLIIVVSLPFYYYNKWKNIWELEEVRSVYPVHNYTDDTLRVIMIGDSWVGMHSEQHLDSQLRRMLCEQTARPVKVYSKGKGGKRSRGIYDLMFKTEGDGTKALLLEGADYCVISAGINDAAGNLGTRQYCYYMELIISFLLKNKIRPVIIEAPNVNIWKMLREIPVKRLIIDYSRSIMTGCKLYNYAEYREALRNMLLDEKILDSVLYVDALGWNSKGYELDENLFIEDQAHLNRKGYELLDSCIALEIATDLRQIKWK